MNPYLQEILHDITTRLAKLEAIEPTVDGWPLWSGLPPPKKEWVGLTAADLMELVAFTHMTMENALSVEAKLKEKNA